MVSFKLAPTESRIFLENIIQLNKLTDFYASKGAFQ